MSATPDEATRLRFYAVPRTRVAKSSNDWKEIKVWYTLKLVKITAINNRLATVELTTAGRVAAGVENA